MDALDEEDDEERERSKGVTFRDYEDAEDWQDILLPIAAQFGETAAMERLVAAGADINGRTNILHEWFADGWTPLMVAAIAEHGASPETVRWLLEHGADPHLTSRSGHTAAWYAAGKHGNFPGIPCENRPDSVERLRLLLDAGLDPHEATPDGYSLLTEACCVGDPARVRLLLERGVSPHPVGGPTDNSYCIPLVCAAMSGSVECVQLLLNAGANVHERTVSRDELPGHTVVEYAATADVVRVLVAAGADVNAHSRFWDVLDQALDNASGDSRKFEIVEALTEAGASLHARGHLGQSRLHMAAYMHKPGVVDWLLSKGVAPDTTDTGNTPLHLACLADIVDDWLEGYEIYDSYYPGTNCEYTNCEYTIRNLVKAGISVDAPGYLRRSPLHLAVVTEKGNPVAIRTLLELGAQPDLADEMGHTPLPVAAFWCSCLECIQLLLDAGADPTRPDPQGCTPLDHYTAREKEGRANPDVHALLVAAAQGLPRPQWDRRSRNRRRDQQA